MAASKESGPESQESTIDFNEISLSIIPGKVNGFPVKALYSCGSGGCYMTMACVLKCQLSDKMDTRTRFIGDVIAMMATKKVPLLGSVQVPIEFEVKLPDGQTKAVVYPTLFFVVEKDVAEIVLGSKFPVSEVQLRKDTAKLIIGGGEIPILPKGEWDEPARSAQYILATRFLKLRKPRPTKNQVSSAN